MADILLSCRRDDGRSAAGRLADRLEALFGPERVFRDVDSIAPGLDFEAALATGLPVIPVLVEGANMPPATAMAASLAPFARCQAIGVDDAGWHDGVARLAAQLQQRPGVDPSAPAGPAQRTGSGALELVDLLARPRRVILRRTATGGRDALQRTTLLLLASLLLGTLLIGLPLELGFGLVGWVPNGTLLGLLVAAGAVR